MALPIPNTPKPDDSKNEAAAEKPKGLPGLPPLAPSKPEARPAPAARPPRKPSGLPTVKAPEPPAAPEEDDDGDWVVDPKTGIKHRLLIPNNPEAIKAFKASKGKGLSLDQMRRYTQDVDFDLDNLNGMANDFLGHLRVAPSKEEIAQMRLEREARLKRDAARAKLDAEVDSEDESDEDED